MAEIADVRRLALALPEVIADPDPASLRVSVGGKAMAWVYLERSAPKQPRRPRPDVIAVRCGIERKEMLIEAAPEIYFDDDHYRGYPAVLVRLAAIDEAELAVLIGDAWRVQAPRRLVKAMDGGR